MSINKKFWEGVIIIGLILVLSGGAFGIVVIEDDMADDSISDWNQAGITVTFDPAGHYEITEVMGGSIFLSNRIKFC